MATSAEIRESYEKWKREVNEEGRKEGRQEGERALLTRQLRKRFGELPADAIERLQKAGEAELERWSDQVLVAQSLADVWV